MATIYNTITKVIGKCKSVRGGRDWPKMYSLTSSGEGKFSQVETDEIIKLLKSKFDCWELVQNFGSVDYIKYIFVVKNAADEYIGFCKINPIYNVASECPIEITYGDTYLIPTEAELHKSYMCDVYTKSYLKI